MAIPDFQTIMLPLMQLAENRQEYALKSAVELLAEKFGLSGEERSQLLPSGRQTTFANRIAWSKTHLTQAGLLESTRRGHFKITQSGLALLSENPDAIGMKLLERYPTYRDFRQRSSVEKNDSSVQPEKVHVVEEEHRTPEEMLAAAYKTIRQSLVDELLTTIKQCSPRFFEQLVVDLIIAMGYGGSHQEAGQAIGRSGDGGIDGIINEDKLGLDVIYLQAKRWEGTVGRPEIQKFAGALAGQRASKGIFITSSSFSREAEEFVSLIQSKIILVDGKRLADLMIEHNVGVHVQEIYQTKRIDSDYFSEE
ncbi:restriction endonuclease [Pseudogulbenkiania subflava]|uniref:restriction endonuclease n=1 Tax=Pseudogulbenkiania subflava TaxID=451637 RepID=UPI000A14D903|nr:restriction endonuclease [Pseudogulbenkiania subflava]